MQYKELEEIEPTAPETNLGYLKRGAQRGFESVKESVRGLPGDILSLVTMGAPKEIAGESNPLYTAKEAIRPYLPNTAELREKREESLKPRTPGEEKFDQIIGDAAQLFMPGGILKAFGKGAGLVQKGLSVGKQLGIETAKSLGKSAVGNVAGWSAENLTGSPVAGGLVKMGTMAFASTAGGRGKMEKLQQQSYNEGFSKIPEGARFSMAPEENAFRKLIRNVEASKNPDKEFLVKQIELFQDLGGSPKIRDVIEQKQKWNALLRNDTGDTAKTLKEMVNITNNGIHRYGKTNPAFFNSYKAGEELTGALRSTSYVQDFMASHPKLQEFIKNPTVKTLFTLGTGSAGYGLTHGVAKHIIPSAALATGVGSLALGGRAAARTYQLLTKSPIARNAYKNVIQGSFKNDSKAVARNLAVLDKEANKFKFTKEAEEGSEPTGLYKEIEIQ